MYLQLLGQYPNAAIVLCSTSGEIFEDEVTDNSVSLTAIEFNNTTVKTASVNIGDFNNDGFAAGASLVRQLQTTNQLCYIMILSDGGLVNGSELVNGINSCVPDTVPVTGGLAGDGSSFISTMAGLNEEPVSGKIVAIAFYGTHLRIAHGSMGGWEMFGPGRLSSHAFKISEQEYATMNEQLMAENKLKKESIKNLKEAIRNVEDEGDSTAAINIDEDNLLDTIAGLNEQISKRKKVEQELKDSRYHLSAAANRLSQLIANLHHGILLEDENRNIVLTNQLFCDMFNIPASPESLKGVSCKKSAEESKHLFK